LRRPRRFGATTAKLRFFSVQAQVLNLIADLKHRLDLSPLFITHDPRVAAQVCERARSMPITRNLLSSIPGVSWSLRSASEPANA
jgi:ABC-type dipeptide/oligopeptide/nickel transport system ATPase subunit